MIPLAWMLTLSAIIFVIGVIGVLVRRNALIIFMSIELMLNAANLAFVAFARELGSLDGQIFVFFVMTVAAAEVAVGLAIIGAVVLARRPMRAAADGNPGATGRTHPPVAGDSGTDAGADALTPAQRPADDALVGGSAYPEGER